jgi:hypothetical protein
MSRMYLGCTLHVVLHITVVRTDASIFQFVTDVMYMLRSLCIHSYYPRGLLPWCIIFAPFPTVCVIPCC